MGEKYDELRDMFDINDKKIIVDGAKKQETLKQLRLNLKESPVQTPVSRWQIIKLQIYYMDKTILILHLVVCLGIIIWGGNCQQWEQLSIIVSGALGALSLLEVGNLFFSGMTELGESCYLNVSQLTAFQMAYSGLLSLAALMLATISVNLKYQLDIMKLGIYIFVPFVFTECICMTVMTREIGRRNLLALIVVGIFSALFWGVLASIPSLYEASALFFWGIALIAGIGILVIKIRRFFKALDKGELLCAD